MLEKGVISPVRIFPLFKGDFNISFISECAINLISTSSLINFLIAFNCCAFAVLISSAKYIFVFPFQLTLSPTHQ